MKFMKHKKYVLEFRGYYREFKRLFYHQSKSIIKNLKRYSLSAQFKKLT